MEIRPKLKDFYIKVLYAEIWSFKNAHCIFAMCKLFWRLYKGIHNEFKYFYFVNFMSSNMKCQILVALIFILISTKKKIDERWKHLKRAQKKGPDKIAFFAEVAYSKSSNFMSLQKFSFEVEKLHSCASIVS